VNHVVAPAQLDERLESLIAGILPKPREALALGKALFYRQAECGIAAAYADAAQTMACNMMLPCALDGVQGFISK
jgi:enoyl-CoA hydratase/carnithine racemase